MEDISGGCGSMYKVGTWYPETGFIYLHRHPFLWYPIQVEERTDFHSASAPLTP